jgi:hypothetical protein
MRQRGLIEYLGICAAVFLMFYGEASGIYRLFPDLEDSFFQLVQESVRRVILTQSIRSCSSSFANRVI